MVTVAWITPFAPDRSGGGGQIRQAHLLLALARRAQIELICPGPVTDPDVRSAVARLVEVAPVAADWRGGHPWLRRAVDLGASIVPRQPLEVRAFRPVRRTLGAAVASVDADVVLVEFAGLAPLLPPGHPRGRWVLTLHNLPSRMSAQQASVLPHRRQRWFLTRDARAGSAFERRVAAAFDAVITCTDEDAAALGGVGSVLVVPNGVDIEQFKPSPLPAAPRVVFTGALYTTPNVDAARWFCQEIWPQVRREVPTASLDLVGARPVESVRALARLNGVTVHADVVSVVPSIAAARVAVVPIRVGSGTRLKALEAMAAGRPVVGTAIGLEGLGLRAGVNALVADDAATFAAAVVRVLRDDDLAAALAAAGRREVEERFAWAAIAASFAQSVVAQANRGDSEGS